MVQYASALSSMLPVLLKEAGSVSSAISPTNQDPNSLYSMVKKVLGNLDTVFSAGGSRISYNTSINSAFAGMTNWLLDGYNLPRTNPAATNAGFIQENISNAIIGGQSLNAQQQNTTKMYLFIFQEYYQSASLILSQLNQLLDQMTDSLAGR
jgi:hypothetical protein